LAKIRFGSASVGRQILMVATVPALFVVLLTRSSLGVALILLSASVASIRLRYIPKTVVVASIVVLCDLLLLHAVLGGLVMLLLAVAAAIGAIGSLLWGAIASVTGNKDAIPDMRASFIKFSGIALTRVLIAALSLNVGWMHDRLVKRKAFELVSEATQYKATHGEYPLSNTPGFKRQTVHGYAVMYLRLNHDDSAPYVVFDKFNYLRQTIDVQTGVLEPERDW